jgi:hypothetical protein
MSSVIYKNKQWDSGRKKIRLGLVLGVGANVSKTPPIAIENLDALTYFRATLKLL